MKMMSYEVRPAHINLETEDTVWRSYGEPYVVSVHELEAADEVTTDMAAGTLDLMAAAYGHQFEVLQDRLPSGTFRRYFDSTDDRKVLSHAERMRRYISEEDSVYGLIFDQAGEGRQLALAKVSPSRSGILQKIGRQSPNAYLNDIVVDPAHQGQKLASAALFHALVSGNFDSGQALALDGYTGNDGPNEWFRLLGLRKVGVEIDPFVIDEEAGLILPVERYSSDGVASLGAIAERIQDRAGIVPLEQS